MNWKPISNLAGIPDDVDAHVLLHWKDGSQRTTRSGNINYIITSQIKPTHWAIPEPPKPPSDVDGFEEWFKTQPPQHIQSMAKAWKAALAWERSKAK